MGNTTSCSAQGNLEEYTLHALEERCRALIQECEEMSSTLTEKTIALQKRHEVEIQRLQAYNDELCNENEILHTEKERLIQKQRSDAVAIQLLNAELETRNKKIANQQNMLASKTQENDMIRDELGDCVENIENLNDENYTLEKEHEEAKEQIKEIRESSVSKSEHEKVNKEFELYKTSTETVIRTLRTEITQFQESNDLLKSSVDSMQEVNQYNTAEIQRFEAREEALKDKVQTLENKLEARVVEKRALVEEFNETVDNLHVVKEDIEGIQKELNVEREKQIALKKLNFTLKHELKSAVKKMQKGRKKAIRTFIDDKMKIMCETSFQDDCLDVLMNETWIPNDFERWFYEDIYTHIMMYVHNLLTDDKTQ